MHDNFPEYLHAVPGELGRGHNVGIRIVADMTALAEAMARDMADVVRRVSADGRAPTLIVPVGPVDQFPVLAELVTRERLSLRDTLFINMDEYLTDDDEWVALEHPLSFRAFMNRRFYDLLPADLAPPPELRVFPDPDAPSAIGRLIADRGGVDACFGGIGINGHMAFNEPPEPGEVVSTGEFAALPTRVLSLSRETRTINANTVGGSIDVVPRRCVTVGMQEILGARSVRFYCNRPWQSAVVRKVLLGPVSAECPASLLRTHADAELTITELVAARPEISLR